MKKTLITLLSLAGVAMGIDYNTIDYTFGRATVDDVTTITITSEQSQALTLNYVGTTYETGGNSAEGMINAASYAGTYTPNVQLRQNQASDYWMITFSVTNNTSELITLTNMGFDAYVINNDGSNKSDVVRTTDTLIIGETSWSQENLITSGGNTTDVSFVLGPNDTTSVDLLAGETVQVSFKLGSAAQGTKCYNTYAGLKGMSVTYIPEPATATLSLLALCGLAARRRRK